MVKTKGRRRTERFWGDIDDLAGYTSMNQFGSGHFMEAPDTINSEGCVEGQHYVQTCKKMKTPKGFFLAVAVEIGQDVEEDLMVVVEEEGQVLEVVVVVVVQEAQVLEVVVVVVVQEAQVIDVVVVVLVIEEAQVLEGMASSGSMMRSPCADQEDMPKTWREAELDNIKEKDVSTPPCWCGDVFKVKVSTDLASATLQVLHLERSPNSRTYPRGPIS
ncbi:hypothetical protein D1007_16476 [Hordeum vulgare]|nr:hypothetical protein D1007_16476 [Hordeum vulgare]